MDGKNRGKKYIAVLIFGVERGCNQGGIRGWRRMQHGSYPPEKEML
jgi:hypothetical protein